MKIKKIRNPILALVGCIVAAIAYLYTNNLWIFQSEPIGQTETYVDFIDCGQGDSTLLVSKGHAVLIDATTGDHADEVIEHLAARGIEKLDHMVLTHPHEDHIGGASAVLDAVDVERIYMKEPTEGTEPTTAVYLRLLEKIDDKDVDISLTKVGDQFDCGEFRFEILGPIENHEDLNNQSIALNATYGDVSFLFTGDLEKPAERDLVEVYGGALKATVLKAGHHGGGGSSCDDFLDAVLPRYSVISCGANNSYGHPHDDMLERLRERNITYYRTDINGTVTAYTDGKSVSFETEEKL